MSSLRPGAGRGLQRVSTAEGFVLAVDLSGLDGRNLTDDDRGREILAGLSPWASAVIVPDGDLAQDWLDTEAVPRSVGVIRPAGTATPDSVDPGGGFAYAEADMLVVRGDSPPPPFWTGPVLQEVSVASLVDDDVPSLANSDLVVAKGPFSEAPDWNSLDEGFAVPWMVAPVATSFPETVAQARAAVTAGASGIVVGPELWTDLWSDEAEVTSPSPRDEIRSRVVTLVGAIRSGMGTWDIEGPPTSDATQWFGARSFFYHGDIDRYEERTVLIRANSDEAALGAAKAEAEEYGEAQGAVTLDAVQVSPIRNASSETPGDLVEWQEVYTQFHGASSAAAFLTRFVPDESE